MYRFVVVIVAALIIVSAGNALAAPIELKCPWGPGETWQSNGSYYGEGKHTGVDYYCVDFNWGSTSDDYGKPIFAAASGRIIVSGWSSTYGWNVKIDHGGGITTHYAHFSQKPFVAVQENVIAGQVIGSCGGTPSYSPHLHFGIFNDGQSVQPNPLDGQAMAADKSFLSHNSNIIDLRHTAPLNNRNPYGWPESPEEVFGEYQELNWWFCYNSNYLYHSDGTPYNCYLARLTTKNPEYDAGLVYDALGGARHAFCVGWEEWDIWLFLNYIGNDPTPTCGGHPVTPGGPHSRLGMPITNRYKYSNSPVKWRQDFQKGHIINGAIYCYNICAPGWTESNTWSPQFSYLFADAYDRNGASRGIGEANGKVDLNWVSFGKTTAYSIQKFKKGSSTNSMIVYDPQNYIDNSAATNETYYIYGNFYTAWTTIYDIGPWVLGAPTRDRVGNVQYFKYGRMEEVNGIVYAYDKTGKRIWPKSTYKVVEGNSLPANFTLSQNYPNPFNPQTTISYSLPEQGHVTLTIYNILGKKVATLVDEQQEAGEHEIQWNASDYSSGIYFYCLEAGQFVETKKMVLLK